MTTVIAREARQMNTDECGTSSAKISTNVIARITQRECEVSLSLTHPEPASEYAYARNHVCRDRQYRAAAFMATARVAAGECTTREALTKLAIIELDDAGITGKGSLCLARVIASAVIAHRRKAAA